MNLLKLSFILLFTIIMGNFITIAQKTNVSNLSIAQIMQGNDFIGHLPSNITWDISGKQFYFYWNPENAYSDSLYLYNIENKKITKVDFETQYNLPENIIYNNNHTKAVYSAHGDIFYWNLKTGIKIQINNTLAYENNPHFLQDEQKIVYKSDKNLFVWDITTGTTKQITNFKSGSKPNDKKIDNAQNKWLQEQQLALFNVLSEKKQKQKAGKTEEKKNKLMQPLPIYLSGKNLMWANLSPDGNYVSYLLMKRNKSKRTIVPHYVTESGYTEEQNTRPKVGTLPTKFEFYIYDIKNRKVEKIDLTKLKNYEYIPEYTKDYPNKKYTNSDRISYIGQPVWSNDGKNAIINISSNDHKDRWIALIDFKNFKIETLNNQHDTAWIGGPGIGWFSRPEIGWMPDNQHIWFKSEKSGYAHLYTLDIKTKKTKQITKGKFEVYNPKISLDKKFWYFTANINHPGDRQFYRMPLKGGKPEQLTYMTGNNEVSLSPNEKYLAIRYSYSNKPWEIYLMKNPALSDNEKMIQITHSLTQEFKNYPWREPKIITFKASDGAKVYARIYTPEEKQKNNAAIIFVHGAGYLQNAHKWWSGYYREYMFHNLLVDNGYTVLDIDYRASSGYGHDWRTAIYRHMGGKDLSDQVDGAKFLANEYGIDPQKIGIYGGSYGGFITLMAMFKAPDVFKAGAAIRSVTDWAHYNHGYTSPILNTPVTDSLAYVRSSPIYFADGLKGHLLILHGMVDDNVHFQDVVRLNQKLIELGKQNWEMALYPIERHGFVETSSWTDEYIRIFNHFQKYLLGK
ncbi:MAG: prolyl oligopeptidase family serine peptidase [Bacteroidales bacterium]|nr:prolyl oligopeptidase family serine peptidase [Bacteroidales bacterium]